MRAPIKHFVLTLFFLASALWLCACGSSSQPGSLSPTKLNVDSFSMIGSNSAQSVYNPPSRLDSEIAPGYLVVISSNEDANLNGEFRVSEQGTLELPYNINIAASNISVAELRGLIRDSYRTYFRGTPDLEVSIKDRKVWVRAQGLVNKPGTYLLDPKGGLDAIISEAGGLKANAEGISAPKFAKVTGDSAEAVVRLGDFFSGNATVVSQWRGGESIFFQNETPLAVGQSAFDSKYIHVLGQVRAPGEYSYKEQANFFYYLVQAGGPTDRANTDKILLVRSDNSGSGLKTSQISLGDLEEAPALQGGDVLFIQADNLSDLQKDAGVLGNLGGFLGSIATTVLVGTEL